MTPFVRIRIDKQGAITRLTKRRFLRRSISPKRAELIYIPHYIYRVSLSKPNAQEELLAVDAIQGLFSYYHEQATQACAENEAATLPFLLEPEVAQANALDDYRRAVLQASLKSGGQIRIKQTVFEKRIYFPYWVGYFSEKGRISFSAIDAVSGQLQGSKFKQVLLHGFSKLGESLKN